MWSRKSILTRLLEPFQLDQDSSYVSASIGITLFPNDAGDADSLLKNADQAMYVAKSQGRNRFSHFTNALQQAAQQRLRLITDLRSALANDQFCIHFQPIVELASGHIVKAEALLRWQHPQRGMIGPTEFIALAEETGLVNPIGSWVFREAARWAKRWAGLHGRGVQVSVNKSPVQFRAEADDSRALLDYLAELQLPGNSIVIEITEGLLLNAEAGVIERLRKFREAGIQVAIDDFGTGYSSLSYLKKFDIDYLKIDQSFVCNLAPDSDDLALAEAIIVMAHKLGLKVIAEGVETEPQRALLCAAGCDYAQGYLFSQPLPPEQFEALLGLRQAGGGEPTAL
ncbi:putative bifunctional diguanylate cyclase/phosphodiesterase [Undibacterium arcticum]